ADLVTGNVLRRRAAVGDGVTDRRARLAAAVRRRVAERHADAGDAREPFAAVAELAAVAVQRDAPRGLAPDGAVDGCEVAVLRRAATALRDPAASFARGDGACRGVDAGAGVVGRRRLGVAPRMGVAPGTRVDVGRVEAERVAE